MQWEDERLLIEGWQLRKDTSALETLLVSHARMVYFWARKVSRDKTEQEELVAEGLLGLIKAVDMFDQRQTVRFSTYARWWVKNSVLTALSRLRSIVEVPAGSGAAHPQYASDGEDGLEQLASDEPTPEEHAISRSSNDALREQISNALAALDGTDREVVVSRCLTQPPMNISDLATRLGITSARLRQIERRAMARLKYELVERGVLTSRVH